MEYAEMTEARLSVLEARMAALEQRLAALEQGSTVRRKRKELTPDQRQEIRARLVAGQERKRREREAAAAAEAEEAKRKKGTKNGSSQAAN